MKTIYEKEMNNYYNGFSGYLFQLVFALSIGVCVLIYNIGYQVTNFEYVFNTASLVFIILIPLLTMKNFAEERKQKTDQLLYSLPLDMSEIVVGKFLADVCVFGIPLIVVGFYPLLIRKFGDVYLPCAYGSLFAFFLVGVTFISIGMFVSTLTENQGFSAGITAVIILVNYLLITLTEYVSGTVFGTIIVFTVLILVLTIVIKGMIKNTTISFIIGGILEVIMLVLLLINQSLCQSLLVNIMNTISLYSILDTFISGVFDINKVVFLLSITALFIYLSIQSMEKRRYN